MRHAADGWPTGSRAPAYENAATNGSWRWHRRYTRCRRDPPEPRAHGRIRGDVESALVGFVCVGEQRQIGNRQCVTDKKGAIGQMSVHHTERCVTAFFQSGQARVVVLFQKHSYVARDCNCSLMTVL